MKWLIVFFCLTSVACSDGSNPIKLSGRIDSQMYQKLDPEKSANKDIIISSGGGETDYAFKIAQRIIENQNGIVVKDYCISACAEDILPAAKSISFRKRPIIGFHRNSFMNRAQMIRYGGDVSNCSNKGIKNQQYLHELRGLNTEFWKETEKRLSLVSYQVVPKGKSCPWKRRKFRNYMWLPTSKQLRELWGLKFQGEVCADEIAFCRRRIDARWKKGTRIVLGDEIYISKGR